MALTCVYCGQAYPAGTPASGSEVSVLTAHIKICAKHPLRTAEAQLSYLRRAIAEAVDYTLTGDVDEDDAQLVDRLHTRRALPDRCPPALVWKPSGPRIWTGHGWMDAGTDSRAEAICAAHNGVLSGIFGAEAMP